MNKNVGIIGAGSMGTAMANLLAKKGCTVRLYVRREDLYKKMKLERRNVDYFSEIKLSDNIFFYNNIEEVSNVDILLLAIPSHAMRDIVKRISLVLDSDTCILSVSKGIEDGTLKRMSEVILEEIQTNNSVAVLSGPNIAKEILYEFPTRVVIAGKDKNILRELQSLFTTNYFNVSISTDLIGVEYAGALKNVIAILAGMADGMNYGYNTKASIITEGIKEIQEIGVALGGEPQTFYDIAGLGDLIVTSLGGRNRYFGELFAKGNNIQEINAQMRGVIVEGYKMTKVAYDIGKKYGFDLRLINATYNILYKKEPIERVLKTRG